MMNWILAALIHSRSDLRISVIKKKLAKEKNRTDVLSRKRYKEILELGDTSKKHT